MYDTAHCLLPYCHSRVNHVTRLSMKDNPRWMELCQQASVEQDSVKLMELVKEINRLLAEKEKRLQDKKPTEAE